MTPNLPIIGINTLVDLAGITQIPAKVDTGADSSAIWASNIMINAENQLEFTLFAPESAFFTGEKLVATDFKVQKVRNSTGDLHLRYKVALAIKLEGHEFSTHFTLADRSRNQFPILIGRKTLAGKFLVDVTKNAENAEILH